MFLEWIYDPAAWVGLLTLIILEIVLGIDNLVFIAILADKLPENQRNKARLMGLGLAMAMRIVLLFSISWIVTLTQPLFSVGPLQFSGRDMIMIVGGLFLLFKATMELHERLEGHHGAGKGSAANALFWQVLIQIVVLDAVFSLDSVITAVGMIKYVEVMVIAVIVSMGIMMLSSKPLMVFVSRHPTVVILCLGFLLMIGMTLLAEGFGFHVPKGYMYAAIGFAVVIEMFNLFVRRNATRLVTTGDLRDKTASVILGMLGGKASDLNLGDAATSMAEKVEAGEVYSDEEKEMVRGVLTLGNRSVRSIMTPRSDIDLLDVSSSQEEIASYVKESVHSRLLVADEGLENIVGVVSTKEILVALSEGKPVDIRGLAESREVLMVPDAVDVLVLLAQLKVAPFQIAVIYDEHGSVIGLVTQTDYLEAIAGEFPDEDETVSELPQTQENTWVFYGSAPIELVNSSIEAELENEAEDYSTLSGYIMFKIGGKPKVGTTFEDFGYRFEVIEMSNLVPGKVQITKVQAAE